MSETDAKAKSVELPSGTAEVAGWAELHTYWSTVERAKDGAVYFVNWAWGSPSVLFVVYPDGRIWARDD